MLRALPLVFFMMTCVVLVLALYYDPAQSNNSQMIGKAMPQIEVAPWQGEPKPDQKRIVNLFATWCTPCIAELPYLEQVNQATKLPIVGVAWRDKEKKLGPWLEQYGNPFDTIYMDAKGAVGIGLGVKGLPESYVVDVQNKVIWHHEGPILESNVQDVIAEIKALP